MNIFRYRPVKSLDMLEQPVYNIALYLFDKLIIMPFIFIQIIVLFLNGFLEFFMFGMMCGKFRVRYLFLKFLFFLKMKICIFIKVI